MPIPHPDEAVPDLLSCQNGTANLSLDSVVLQGLFLSASRLVYCWRPPKAQSAIPALSHGWMHKPTGSKNLGGQRRLRQIQIVNLARYIWSYTLQTLPLYKELRRMLTHEAFSFFLPQVGHFEA